MIIFQPVSVIEILLDTMTFLQTEESVNWQTYRVFVL